MRAAIVQSLLRLDGVNAVSLSVDGEPLKNADGAVIGLMNEDDFVENTGSFFKLLSKWNADFVFCK